MIIAVNLCPSFILKSCFGRKLHDNEIFVEMHIICIVVCDGVQPVKSIDGIGEYVTKPQIKQIIITFKLPKFVATIMNFKFELSFDCINTLRINKLGTRKCWIICDNSPRIKDHLFTTFLTKYSPIVMITVDRTVYLDCYGNVSFLIALA